MDGGSPSHPQYREDWGSGVPQNSICELSCSCMGAVDRGTNFGCGGMPLQLGRLSSYPVAMAVGNDLQEPASSLFHLHLLSQLQRVDVSHSGRYIHAFPD